VICAGCGSAYIVHFPDNIAEYYEGYFSFEETTPTMERG
jgi:hypothetical protein